MDWQMCISGLRDKGLSVDQIAEGIGVTGSAVREVIAGRTKAPRASAALRLLKLCDVHAVTDPSSDSDPDANRVVPFEAPP